MGVKNQAAGGFTLIELLITLAILTILMTVAAPNFGDYVQTGRMDTVQNRLVASFSQARSEAIRRGENVTVSFQSSGGSLTGWQIKAESETTNIREEDLPDQSMSLTAGASSIVFTRDGELSSATSLCFVADDGDSATDVRYVHLNAIGRVRAWDGGKTDAVCGSGS